MPTIRTAQEAHQCGKCGRQIKAGDRFVIQMTDRFQRRAVCLACAGVKETEIDLQADDNPAL